jgi:hypothetical protein
MQKVVPNAVLLEKKVCINQIFNLLFAWIAAKAVPGEFLGQIKVGSILEMRSPSFQSVRHLGNTDRDQNICSAPSKKAQPLLKSKKTGLWIVWLPSTD